MRIHDDGLRRGTQAPLHDRHASDLRRRRERPGRTRKPRSSHRWTTRPSNGKTLLHKGFGWAVQQGLLTDYKVIVLADG